MKTKPRDPALPADVQSMLPAAQRYAMGLGQSPQNSEEIQKMGFPAPQGPPRKRRGAA